jgi:hypothetical protein
LASVKEAGGSEVTVVCAKAPEAEKTSASALKVEAAKRRAENDMRAS